MDRKSIARSDGSSLARVSAGCRVPPATAVDSQTWQVRAMDSHPQLLLTTSTTHPVHEDPDHDH